jgi:hypothetical protein
MIKVYNLFVVTNLKIKMYRQTDDHTESGTLNRLFPGAGYPDVVHTGLA